MSESIARDMGRDEGLVFAALLKAAKAGAACPTQDDLADLLGGCSVSTTVKVVQRLETQGRIRVQRFQRGRIVTVVADAEAGVDRDVSTAAPANRTPHWRDIPDRPLPTVPLRRVQEDDVDLAEFIVREAFSTGKTPPDMIVRLLKIGAVVYMAEKE